MVNACVVPVPRPVGLVDVVGFVVPVTVEVSFGVEVAVGFDVPVVGFDVPVVVANKFPCFKLRKCLCEAPAQRHTCHSGSTLTAVVDIKSRCRKLQSCNTATSHISSALVVHSHDNWFCILEVAPMIDFVETVPERVSMFRRG